MKVRLEAVGGARRVSVVMVSMPVFFALQSRLVRALFIAHVGDAPMRIHSQDGRRGDCAP